MTNRHTRRGFTQYTNVGQVLTNNQIKCHSRMSLSGIFNACRLRKSLGTVCVEDPRLQASGMTTYFKDASLNKNAFRAPLHFGFTLIELLVVVLNIGILSAVAVPQYQKAVWKTRYTQAKIMVHAIVHAQEIYYLANGQYATSFADLDIDTPAYQTETTDENSKHQTRTRRTFKWGSCRLWENSSVSCTVFVNGGEGLGYGMPYAHAENNPLKSSCLVYAATPTTSPLNNICKAETGLAEPTESGTDYVRYRP